MPCPVLYSETGWQGGFLWSTAPPEMLNFVTSWSLWIPFAISSPVGNSNQEAMVLQWPALAPFHLGAHTEGIQYRGWSYLVNRRGPSWSSFHQGFFGCRGWCGTVASHRHVAWPNRQLQCCDGSVRLGPHSPFVHTLIQIHYHAVTCSEFSVWLFWDHAWGCSSGSGYTTIVRAVKSRRFPRQNPGWQIHLRRRSNVRHADTGQEQDGFGHWVYL